MPNIEKLKKTIDDRGMTVTAVAKQSGILRETLYNRFNGRGEFTAPEIVAISKTLKLSKPEREEIFLK